MTLAHFRIGSVVVVRQRGRGEDEQREQRGGENGRAGVSRKNHGVDGLKRSNPKGLFQRPQIIRRSLHAPAFRA